MLIKTVHPWGKIPAGLSVYICPRCLLPPNRMRFLFCLLIPCVLSFSISEPEQRPNILWILAEDMSPDLGFLGVPEVRTPNIDALANKGMYFEHVFTTSPVCSPSRSAFHTGMYQMTIGAHNHRSHRAEDPSEYPFPLPKGVRILPDWLRDAGYFTANIRDVSEDAWFRGTGKTDWNFTYSGKPFDTDQWADLKGHQPFYAQINFSETHRGRAWNEAHNRIERPAEPEKVRIPPYYPDHPEVQQDWAQYLNTVMALDRKVGDILALLEKDGLVKNTIVVFMADHGRAMVRGKQWPYDSGLHVPLIIYYPPGIEAPIGYSPGTVSDQLISSIDVTATTIAMAGMDKPESMQGRVFLGERAEGPRSYVYSGRDRGDETVDRIRTVRSKRFRYIRNYYPEKPFLQLNRYKEASYPTMWVLRKMHQEGALHPEAARLMASSRPTEELYDLKMDPHEINNLANSLDHQEIIADLRQNLDDWLVDVNDLGRFPESPEVHAFYEQKMKENYETRLEEIWDEWGIKEVP